VIFAPFVSPHKYQEQQIPLRHLPPLSTGVAEVKDTAVRGIEEDRFYLLGTDHLGRDMVSRLIYGGRISITVGVLGVLVSGAIGVFLGLVAGYYRGVVDDVIMRAVDIFMSIPLLFLALMVLFILGPSFTNIIIVFAVARWMLYCRVTRGVVMSLREQTFVEAARAIGCKDQRIISRHILPNLITPLMTIAALEVPRNILTESALSFLGFGIQPPESSWGLMLAAGRQYITSAWWIVVIPGMAIFLTALSFNLFGVWLRAVSDPLQRWRWLKATKESKEAGITF
jgi:peptide/nickel transport system permease protein